MHNRIAIRAGSRAIKIIRDEGLNLSRVKVVAGASGSAKFLVLTGIDRALMSLFKERTDPLYLVGTSIGAFRMAAFCREDPVEAIDRLEKEYIAQQYSRHPSKQDVTCETMRILDAFIDDKKIDALLHHPFMRINFLSDKCRGLVKSDRTGLQWLGLGMAAGINLMTRKGLGIFFERALFCAPGHRPPFASMNQFPMTVHNLTPTNFKSALLSSGSIPIAMAGVSDIDGVPGVFRDGGILDYHLDIPFLPDNDKFALFPHFYETITPGWFDKALHRKPNPEHMKNVVIVAPSKHFVSNLPFNKIPDRKDFFAFKGKDKERRLYWEKVVKQSRQLGDDFIDAIDSGKIRQMVTPI